MIKRKPTIFPVYLLAYVVWMMLLTACSGIRTVGEYDATKFEEPLLRIPANLATDSGLNRAVIPVKSSRRSGVSCAVL